MEYIVLGFLGALLGVFVGPFIMLDFFWGAALGFVVGVWLAHQFNS